LADRDQFCMVNAGSPLGYDAVISTAPCRGSLRYTLFLFDAGPRYCVYDPISLALRGYHAHDGKAGFDAITCGSTPADYDIAACAGTSCQSLSGVRANGTLDGGGLDADGSLSTHRVCGDLAERDLHSIDDVKAALRASPAFPFPGGWGPCTGTFALCPAVAPDLSFDQQVTMMQCGANYETGFRAMLTFPVTIVEAGPQTSTGSPIYELQIQAGADVKKFVLTAQGQPGGAVGFKLLEPGLMPPQATAFEPLAPLP
jgi:hypothetical protein